MIKIAIIIMFLTSSAFSLEIPENFRGTWEIDVAETMKALKDFKGYKIPQSEIDKMIKEASKSKMRIEKNKYIGITDKQEHKVDLQVIEATNEKLVVKPKMPPEIDTSNVPSLIFIFKDSKQITMARQGHPHLVLKRVTLKK